MKFGFDLHGVIDAKPEFFSEFTKLLVEAGHEVHILTGPPDGKKLREELDATGVMFTHLFSIADWLKSEKVEMWQDKKGDWWSHPYDWDRAKGVYCERNKIDMHFDDTDSYAYFFKTPFCRFFSKDTKRVQKRLLDRDWEGLSLQT